MENRRSSSNLERLRMLLKSGKLLHPYQNEKGEQVANFTDLATVVASCCGATNPSGHVQHHLLHQIGGIYTKHVVLVLCDGMGISILKKHLGKESFLMRNLQPETHKLRAVFPSTTPAALTSLATAAWPGQHGMPGWDLREQAGGCEYPGESSTSAVQLRILADQIGDHRDGDAPVVPQYYASIDDVFVAEPWARKVLRGDTEDSDAPDRKLVYVNAYNAGGIEALPSECTERQDTDFSIWQTGRSPEDTAAFKNHPLLRMFSIRETSFETLGLPEGATVAIEAFADGLKRALSRLSEQENNSFTYVYTAHPDKHMHALGVDHEQVAAVVRGLDRELERFWNAVGNHESINSDAVTLIVTADHGHISVHPDEMVVLPPDIEACLEYANVGVLGKGRHAYLHCRSGLQKTLQERWSASPALRNNFLLLTIEEASEARLFGPDPLKLEVRPRVGDFVAISVGSATLVSPRENQEHAHHCQGAHGSLLPEEMEIPLIICRHENKESM